MGCLIYNWIGKLRLLMLLNLQLQIKFNELGAVLRGIALGFFGFNFPIFIFFPVLVWGGGWITRRILKFMYSFCKTKEKLKLQQLVIWMQLQMQFQALTQAIWIFLRRQDWITDSERKKFLEWILEQYFASTEPIKSDSPFVLIRLAMRLVGQIGLY